MERLAELMARQPRAGRVDWIALRSRRLEPVTVVTTALLTDAGLSGDHARPGPRALTIMQTEHLPVIAALIASEVLPETLRRNLLISGINLASLRNVALRIGGAVVRITGPCAPCSRMEAALGPGAYNAMRGHGGWCAEVVAAGAISLGDAVRPA